MEGYLGNLTEEQSKLLYELWKLVIDRIVDGKSDLGHRRKSDAEITNTDLTKALWKALGHEDIDALLLRFLRARKWKVENAYSMLLDSLIWRIKYKTDEILLQGDFEIDQNQLSSGKSYSFNTDKTNQLVCYCRVKLHSKSAQTLEQSEKFVVYLMEMYRKLLTKDAPRVCVVFDLKDFNMGCMDFPTLKFLVSCFQSYYPESLGKGIVLNAPWIFQGCWNAIKQFLDPVVKAKIQFLDKYEDLSIYIDSDKIPKSFGGTSEFEYEYIPPSESDKPLQDTEYKDSIKQKSSTLQHRLIELTRQVIEGATIDLGERDSIKEQLVDLTYEFEKFETKTWYHRRGIINGKTINWNIHRE